MQKSNVQQKDELKDEFTVEFKEKDDLNIEKYIEFTVDSSKLWKPFTGLQYSAE